MTTDTLKNDFNHNLLISSRALFYFSKIFNNLKIMNFDRDNSLLKEIYVHANESIIVVNSYGAIIMINPATEKLFGYSESELINKPVEILIPEHSAQGHHKNRENYNKNPHTRKMGLGIDLFAKKKNDSQFPVEISLSPFMNGEEKFVLVFIIDITQRKNNEQISINNQKKLELLTQELKETNERLEAKVQDRTKVLLEALDEIEKSRTELTDALEKEKELNELKSRFLSMASHEFRTPLTTILSSASLIQDYTLTEQQEKRNKHVARISSAVNNLNDILSDFLSLSKIEEGKVEATFILFDIKSLIEEVIDEMKGILKDGQLINYNHFGNSKINLDPKLFRNVLINLISNAIKFSEENKIIEIETHVEDLIFKLSVKDNGIGISEEDKEHLFQRFFRGQNATNIQGTGLGLNIIASYVEHMSGKISVESKLEVGTKFIIEFKNNN